MADRGLDRVGNLYGWTDPLAAPSAETVGERDGKGVDSQLPVRFATHHLQPQGGVSEIVGVTDSECNPPLDNRIGMGRNKTDRVAVSPQILWKVVIFRIIIARFAATCKGCNNQAKYREEKILKSTHFHH